MYGQACIASFLESTVTADSISTLTSALSNGIPIRFASELASVFALLEPHEALFSGEIFSLLALFQKPLVASKASDFLNYGTTLTKLLNALVWTFVSPSLAIRRAAAAALDSLACQGAAQQPDPMVLSTQGSPILREICSSHVVEAFAEGLRISASDLDTLGAFLLALKKLTVNQGLCKKAANCGILSRLLLYMRTISDNSYILILAVDSMWNMLELDSEGAAFALGNPDSLEILGDILKQLMAKSFREKDRVLRNDLVALLLLISRIDRAAFSEKPEITELALEVLGKEDRDEEFRVLLLALVTSLCSDEQQTNIRRLCDESRLVKQLLVTIDVAHQQSAGQIQSGKFQSAALHALFTLVRVSPRTFLHEQGVGIVLRFAKSCAGSSRTKALQLVLLLSEQGEEMRRELVQQNAVSSLLELLKVSQESNVGEDKTDILQTLANIGEAENFRAAGGIEVLARELLSADGHLDAFPSLQISLVNCVWLNIAGTGRNEGIFIDKLDGIFRLMDLFETAPLDIKRMTLACLNDLLRNPRAVAQFYAWHSKRDLRGSIKHLLDLWLFEQTCANAVAKHGVMTDSRRPLNPGSNVQELGNTNNTTSSSHFSEEQRNTQFDSSFYTPVPLGDEREKPQRVSEDTRPLIFAIFKRLDFRVKEPLSIEEATQLPVIKKFPECRELEIWQDIDELLLNEGTDVTEDDARWRDAEIRRLQNFVEQARQEQLQLSEAQTAQDLGAVKATVDAFLSEKIGILRQNRNTN